MSTIIQNAFCSKITSEFDNRTRILNSYGDQLNYGVRSVDSAINGVTDWSPHWAMNLFKQRIEDNLDSLVPSFNTTDSIDQIVNLINTCVFSKNDPMLSKPSTLLTSLKVGIKSGATSILDSLADIGGEIFPEFLCSKILNGFKEMVEGFGIGSLIPQSLQSLDCLSMVCGINIGSRLIDIEDFMNRYSISDGLGILPAGSLDINALMKSVAPNVSDYYLAQISRTYDQLEGVYARIDTAVDGGREILKRAVPDEDFDA